MYEPYGNHKSKTHNRHTKSEKKEHKHVTKEKYQATREEIEEAHTTYIVIDMIHI